MKLPLNRHRGRLHSLALGLAVLLPAFVCAQEADEDAVPEGAAGRRDTRSAGATPLDSLLAASNTPRLTIPATSTTSRQFYKRLTTWANARWKAPLTRELQALEIEEPEKNAEYLWNWFCTGPAGGKMGYFTDLMRKTVATEAKAPLAQFIIGNMALESRYWEESRKRLRVTVDQTGGERGDPLIAALAAARINGDKSRPQDAKLQAKALALLAEAFAPDRFGEADGDFLTHIIGMRLAALAHSHLGEKLIPVWEKATLPEWVRQYAIGKAHVSMAWRERGRWANSVTEKGWKGFAEHLTLAGKALRKSWQLRPERPEAAMEMISVAMAGHTPADEPTRMWFDRAIAAECDHRFAYEKMINSLRPRWGGSLDRLLAFGIACARTERYETDVPYKLFNVLSELGDELPDYRPVLQQPDIAKLLIKTRRAQIESWRGVDAAQVRVIEGYLAVTAMLAGDRKLAYATIAAMHPDGKPISMPVPAGEWASGWNIDWIAERFQGMIEQSPAAPAWERAGEARDERFFDTALTELGEVETKCPDAKPWLDGWRSLVVFERDFAKGEWLRFPHNLVAWQTGYGFWTRSADEQLTGRLTQNQSLGLFSRVRLGQHFELRGKVRLETASKDRRFSFGVLFGHSLFRKQNAQAEHVALFTTTDPGHFRSEIGHRRYLKDDHKPGAKVKLTDTNTFRIERRGTRVNAWVNDQQALKDAELPEDLPDAEGAIGLMAYPYVAQEPIHFSELEARRL